MATNNIYTQFILQQQHYMTQQQQFLEHLILGNNCEQLGDEIKVLKMQIQTLTANTNRNQAKVTQEIKALKKENSLLKEEVQTIQSEYSFMDSIVENASNNAGEDGDASAKEKEPLNAGGDDPASARDNEPPSAVEDRPASAGDNEPPTGTEDGPASAGEEGMNAGEMDQV